LGVNKMTIVYRGKRGICKRDVYHKIFSKFVCTRDFVCVNVHLNDLYVCVTKPVPKYLNQPSKPVNLYVHRTFPSWILDYKL
jgi:hypothetical protein